MFAIDREPSNVKDILKHKDNDKWFQAMEEEWFNIQKPNMGMGSSKREWEKDRQNAYSKILGNGATKQKARLVAIGYSQINGIDYKETFSPVVILTGSLVCSLPLSLCFSLSYSLVALHKDSIQSTWLYLSVPFGYVCWINQSPSLVDIALAISVWGNR